MALQEVCSLQEDAQIPEGGLLRIMTDPQRRIKHLTSVLLRDSEDVLMGRLVALIYILWFLMFHSVSTMSAAGWKKQSSRTRRRLSCFHKQQHHNRHTWTHRVGLLIAVYDVFSGFSGLRTWQTQRRLATVAPLVTGIFTSQVQRPHSGSLSVRACLEKVWLTLSFVSSVTLVTKKWRGGLFWLRPSIEHRQNVLDTLTVVDDCRVLSTRHIKARDHLVVCSAAEPLSVQLCSSSNFSCIISCLLPEPLKAVCHKAALLSLLLMCSWRQYAQKHFISRWMQRDQLNEHRIQILHRDL